MVANLDLESGRLYRKVLPTRSKYARPAARHCHLYADHPGRCSEFPFLHHLKATHPRVADKIERDAIMTTGAAWKSKEAGPNRILRWVMLESDEELIKYGIDMSTLQPQVVSKLREKAADYDSCIRVAMWLTHLAYQMRDAFPPPQDVRSYLEFFFGQMVPASTTCTVCRSRISFKLFEEARRGKATIETCHKDPRIHSPINVGFAHRECNIAQGSKTLDEFYDWITQILARARPDILH